MAPARPTTAEPMIKICKCRAVTSLPIAEAATSLSRIARIIRPQGLFKARSDKKITASNTAASTAMRCVSSGSRFALACTPEKSS